LHRGGIGRRFTCRIGNPLQRRTEAKATRGGQFRPATRPRYGGTGEGIGQRLGPRCDDRRQRGFRRRLADWQIGISDRLLSDVRFSNAPLDCGQGKSRLGHLDTRGAHKGLLSGRIHRDGRCQSGCLLL
jgi:hypothetical protein